MINVMHPNILVASTFYMTKNCLIIGSRSSLGIEIENIFKRKKYNVFGTSRKHLNSLNSNEIYFDFEKFESFKNLEAKIPTLDSLIFSTGILKGKELNEYKEKDIFNVFQTNIIGPIMTLMHINHKLNKNCSVIFIGSISGSAGSYDEVYASSKSAIHGLIKSLAKKSRNSIRFNCIEPGLIENSSMSKQFSALEIEKHKEETPTNKLNSLEEIAKICFKISQKEWIQLNGQIIRINGGRYV